MATPYFTTATFRFLRELAANNTREWFSANRARYEETVREPYLALLADLQAPLARISPHYVADLRRQGGSLFRIHRDTRYAHDKSPYKSWAGARLFHKRARETEAPSFYIHIEPGHCFVGGGLWHPQPETTRRIRDFLVNNPSSWKKATRSKTFQASFALGGASLVRPPRGYEPHHELIEDLKRKDFVATAAFTGKLATSTELHPYLVEHLNRVAPLVDYLCASLDLDFT
ncbi:DUF2461 domain-containing protein [Dokdonella sp.]|uniref:DUF2461 domain-containing protein n=1 Tax=Dokdonella sp. TaxID=2291710 RepID=UPI0025BEE3F6|nr:DUF2461 domain-containing protein [Dokdonella sp.]MBX3693238.1 DUF2461 domain-containing protein [Dokdonella sp.]